MKVALIIILTVIAALFVMIEVGLRSLFGFGNPLIYIGDDRIGYLLAPNQRTRRFGNRIEINQYSMRSAPIEKTASSSMRVLLLGDSIANGGWWTDQDNTISSLMMRSLRAKNISKYQEMEVLNASANSWGPRNELAYLQQFGTFNAQAIVLLINTDDLFATAPTSLPVGRDRNYPDSKPALALVEVFERYVTKQKLIPELQAVQDEKGDRVGINLEAISKIQALTRENNCQFLLVMTPLLREIGKPGSRDYEITARQRLKDFTEAQQITYIDFLPTFNAIKEPKAIYQDHIHFNLQGNQLVREKIELKLLELLGDGTPHQA
ncbi:SGNH/GDSL hydrolase family protein [Plectonema radiosum NIES-515]|uniref:SGNH/GDSL hydrolase family protein n=1 Tax=Plectonema radiosum NIES-515 TaxID=2986073 RepID=A0ABT3B5Y9_9CYAN|nr:SGNH/GDSL hydrolase family protein [Plectonema radiosum]MCV3216776.1 SGNH/GDSL hydrolase family protein [Plectonema radiosum NIES-515]